MCKLVTFLGYTTGLLWHAILIGCDRYYSPDAFTGGIIDHLL